MKGIQFMEPVIVVEDYIFPRSFLEHKYPENNK